jgi:hypothetical protein
MNHKHNEKHKKEEFMRKTNSLTQLGVVLVFIAIQFTARAEVDRSFEFGSTKLVVSGFADVNYINEDGGDDAFSGSLNPVILWQLNERLLFEGEAELAATEDEEEAEVEYAELLFIVNDYLTLGGGKFLVPFGTFGERVHPTWINKLPDAPLGFGHGGLVPLTAAGFQARGGTSAGPVRYNYAAFVINGPEMNEEAGEEAGGHGHGGGGGVGMLDFDKNEFDNLDAYGGRVGILPFSLIELGYSVYATEVDTDFNDSVDVFVQGIDFSCIRNSELLRGIVDVRAEWIFSDMDQFGEVEHAKDENGHGDEAPHEDEEDEDAEEGDDDHDDEELFFDNTRDGGYVQVAYRPTQANTDWINNLEAVCRYDMINHPGREGLDPDQERVTVGLNYWFGPSSVLKMAYRFEDKDGHDVDGQDALLVQTAIGF